MDKNEVLKQMGYTSNACKQCRYFHGPDYGGGPVNKSDTCNRFEELHGLLAVDPAGCCKFFESIVKGE